MSFAHRTHARCGCAAAHLALASRPFSLPGTTRKYERDRPFGLTHIALDLSLDVARRSVSGVATLDVARVDAAARELRLDAVAFELRSVEVDRGVGFAPAPFVYDGDTLAIEAPAAAATFRVRVAYAASPRRGMYFLAPDEHVRDRPHQVWTQCQDEDARFWFPCHDKPHLKQTTEIRVRVPVGWYALSNGSLVAHEVGPDGEVFHWRQARPHASYLVTLVAGAFAHVDGGEVGGVPLSYLVPRGREGDVERTFGETPGMIRQFEQLTGVAFPWEKYAQVVVSDFIFGGMENTSATTLYEHTLLDERAAIDLTSTDLIAHELAHQWFGDLVTCRDWSHGWLNEGFATFMEHVDRERRLGDDEYAYGVKQDQDNYLAEAHGRYQRPIVCSDYEAPIDLFDRHLYEKGGLVLHVLRRTLGDEVFWRGVGEYLRRHAHGVVETRDLQRALEAASGRGLDRFFEQWVHRAGHPQLEVKLTHEDGALHVEIKQTQKGGDAALFALELELEVHVDGAAPRREVLRVARASEAHVIASEARPRFVVVDPRHLVVGEVTLEVPADMLRAQLLEAPTARGRWVAAQALGKRDDGETLAALARVLGDDEAFWGLRAEAAYALAQVRSTEALQALIARAAVAHPKVRRAVAWALGRFQRAEAAAALRPLALRDASYAVEAEAARSLGQTRQAAAFDTLIEVLDRPAWCDLIRSGAVDGLAALRDDRAVPHVLARTRYGVPTRARRAAIRALPRLTSDRRVREALEDLLEDADPHLRVDVALALGDMGDAKSRGALSKALDRELDGRVRRRLREVLRDLGATPRAESQRLSDEVDKLRAEQGDLRSRLAKLEALVAARAGAAAAVPGGAASSTEATGGGAAQASAGASPSIATPAAKSKKARGEASRAEPPVARGAGTPAASKRARHDGAKGSRSAPKPARSATRESRRN